MSPTSSHSTNGTTTENDTTNEGKLWAEIYIYVGKIFSSSEIT